MFQPCPEIREFREDQCSAFNSYPYEGVLYSWIPHSDDNDPCALTCRGKQIDTKDSVSEETVMVVAKLAEKVQDGTRCRPGSLDMCIDGKCQVRILIILVSYNFSNLNGKDNSIIRI